MGLVYPLEISMFIPPASLEIENASQSSIATDCLDFDSFFSPFSACRYLLSRAEAVRQDKHADW